jgi:hypothetical protein
MSCCDKASVGARTSKLKSTLTLSSSFQPSNPFSSYVISASQAGSVHCCVLSGGLGGGGDTSAGGGGGGDAGAA